MIRLHLDRTVISTLAVVVTAGCAGRSNSGMTAGYGDEVASGVERLRAATQPYYTLDAAVAAGYARDVADCLVHEHHGAMGYHHVNRDNVDARIDIERPEILLYEKLPGGEYRLNGVEFIVPYRVWSRDSIAPTVMGQPLKHEDNLKFWYLHAWVWTPNKDGLFSDFHPDVQCEADSRKVFRPSSS